MILKKTFKKKKILITGHTGFKGSWLTAWMNHLGAKVVGVSDYKFTNPSHFKMLNLSKKIISYNCDIRKLDKLKKIFVKHKPDFVFHLAAQSLVQPSYAEPKKTFGTNIIGTLNVLETLREIRHSCVAIIITSDKVYKNLEIKRGYKETDILGGYDPYSASKAGAEIILKSYIKSYFKKDNKVKIGIARAGNVIGGGDWSAHRLIPDCVKSWSKNKPVELRNPKSTRPWQHVLEVVWGYILFSAKLKKLKNLHGQVFNFGPDNKYNHNVSRVVSLMKKYWKDVKFHVAKKKKRKFYESGLLKLNSNKVKKKLKWSCILSFKKTIELVAIWYKEYYNKKNRKVITISQIDFYMKLLEKNYKR